MRAAGCRIGYPRQPAEGSDDSLHRAAHVHHAAHRRGRMLLTGVAARAGSSRDFLPPPRGGRPAHRAREDRDLGGVWIIALNKLDRAGDNLLGVGAVRNKAALQFICRS